MSARRIAATLFVASAFFGSVAAAAQPTRNMTGTWVRVHADGNLPRRAVRALEEGAPLPITVDIAQTSAALTITRTISGRRERASFPLDGREATQRTPQGVMRSRAGLRGRDIVIRGERPFSGPFGRRQVPFVQVHTLSNDGNRMTVTLTLDTPLGEKTRRVVFRRTAPTESVDRP